MRAHILLQVVLAERIFSVIEFSDLDEETIKLLIGSDEEFVSIETINSSDGMQKIFQKFENALLKLSNRGATTKFWIQYFKMVNLMKNFIAAERMGDWNQHIKCVRTIIPYFHSAGHIPFAKGAHSYLQEVMRLKEILNEEEFKKFTEGYFTIRRSKKLYSGV